ncbi:unnamed protein product [Closterium sp. NIES-65]|nr:unnamed protein product [Closterium sp. NIES-65]
MAIGALFDYSFAECTRGAAMHPLPSLSPLIPPFFPSLFTSSPLPSLPSSPLISLSPILPLPTTIKAVVAVGGNDTLHISLTPHISFSHPIHPSHHEKAVEQGAEAVVAVGGDGTLHISLTHPTHLTHSSTHPSYSRAGGGAGGRGGGGCGGRWHTARGDVTFYTVVNGFFSNGQPVVPRAAVAQQALRTGDEVQLSEELREQQAAAHMEPSNGQRRAVDVGRVQLPACCSRLTPPPHQPPWVPPYDPTAGQRRAVDVGQVQLPACAVDRCFINVADVHLSARVGRAAVSLKALGPLCYAVAAFKAFPKHRNLDLSIRGRIASQLLSLSPFLSLSLPPSLPPSPSSSHPHFHPPSHPPLHPLTLPSTLPPTLPFILSPSLPPSLPPSPSSSHPPFHPPSHPPLHPLTLPSTLPPTLPFILSPYF